MANSKHLVEDLNGNSERQKFKKILINRCHRLKKQKLHEREILENLQDWRNKLQRQQQNLRDKVFWYLDKSKHGSLYFQIHHLYEGVLSVEQENLTTKLKGRISSILGGTVSTRYIEPFNEAMQLFRELAKTFEKDSEKRVLNFHSTLCNAFGDQRRNSIKLIERSVIRMFINDVDRKGLEELIDEKKPKENYKTRKTRVDRVEEIKRKSQCSYPEAIEQFNKEMEEEIYNGYPSFNTQRNKVYGNN